MSDDMPIPRNGYIYPMRTVSGSRQVLGVQLLAHWKNDPDHFPHHVWLCRLIGTMFQSFIAANLQHPPAAEMLPNTAQLWVEVLIDMRLTEEQDRERIEAASRILLRTMDEWPKVKALIAALPTRSAGAKNLLPLQSDSGPTEADRQAGREALAKLKEMF